MARAGATGEAAVREERPRLWVVVNADDLGLHPAVQRAVEAGAAAGVITSASLLANGPYLRQAVELAEAVDLGVHLNLLRGRPLSPPDELPGLVDGGGCFLGSYLRLWRRRCRGGLPLEAVEREWRRQVERVLELGVRPGHLDSEKHLHAWPELMPLAVRLARDYGIGWVRRPWEPVAWWRWDAGALRARLLALWCRRARADGVGFPRAVWGIADQGPRLSAGRFAAFVRRLGLESEPTPPVVEIACHPGLPRSGDPELPADYGPLRVPGLWRAESESLLSGAWPEVLAELGARLTTYREREAR